MRMLRNGTAVATLLLALTPVLVLDGQLFPESPFLALDAVLAREMGELGAAGAAVVVVRDGRIAYAKGYGVGSTERKTPVTADTLFRAGSITKVFTQHWFWASRTRGRSTYEHPSRPISVGCLRVLAVLRCTNFSHTRQACVMTPDSSPRMTRHGLSKPVVRFLMPPHSQG
jgi:hypothetical protein